MLIDMHSTCLFIYWVIHFIKFNMFIKQFIFIINNVFFIRQGSCCIIFLFWFNKKMSILCCTVHQLNQIITKCIQFIFTTASGVQWWHIDVKPLMSLARMVLSPGTRTADWPCSTTKCGSTSTFNFLQFTFWFFSTQLYHVPIPFFLECISFHNVFTQLISGSLILLAIITAMVLFFSSFTGPCSRNLVYLRFYFDFVLNCQRWI